MPDNLAVAVGNRARWRRNDAAGGGLLPRNVQRPNLREVIEGKISHELAAS